MQSRFFIILILSFIFIGNFYAQQISVTVPNGGESWLAGNDYGITWTDNIVEQVSIQLYEGGVFYLTIVDSTASDGFYSWYIPDTIQGGSDYTIKITSVLNSSITDFSDGNFSIIQNQNNHNQSKRWRELGDRIFTGYYLDR